MKKQLNLLTLASEVYVWNQKHDPDFKKLSADSITACVCVDCEDILNRKLTDEEYKTVRSALALFGV